MAVGGPTRQLTAGLSIHYLPSLPERDAWEVVAKKSCFLQRGTSISSVELEGASNVLSFLCADSEGYDQASIVIITFTAMNFTLVD